ncbi:MAG: hypothetical protein OET81_08665 [Desulfobacteraceae bacterium]|nr:hypothetical protein [Desulfobacteraceae bacterium]MDH3723015.1 hypothetical protein [Desulfobacteraceae bacterium]MDH3876124.1 hypothetical protein [Desulfobacteraceae bacterium]MDH3956749.1 hypothetical protein [Desulfobacteraceae bacterium]
MYISLKGKTAIVTGAYRGIGREIALKLGTAFLSRWVLAGDLEPKSLF